MTLFYFAVFLDIEEVLINSAIDAFFARISAGNLVQSSTLRPGFHFVWTKNLR